MRLANGARLLCLPTTDEPGGAVALQLWVAAGTAAETPEQHGCAHLLEHMLFKPQGEVGDLARRVESVGGDVNAFTSHDETVIYVTVPASGWEGALEALLSATLAPTLDAEELGREIEVVVEEIKQYDDEPGQRAVQALMGMIHGGHAYGRPVLGLAREVRSHDAARLRRFHRRAYAGSRLTLVVVGPVDPRRVKARAQAALGRPAKGARLDGRGVVDARGGQVRLRREDAHEAHVLLGWRVPGLGDPALAALDVAALVLGHGEAARLMRETRRRDQLVTDALAHLDVARDAGTFLVTARTTGEKAGAAAAALAAQVSRMASRAVSGEELARARAVIESDLVYRRETAQGQAHVLGYYAALAGDLGLEAAYFRALAGLDAEAVRAAVARWLPVSAMQVVCSVPESEVSVSAAAELRQELRAIGKGSGKPRRRPARAGITEVTLGCGLRVFAEIDRRVPIAAAWLMWPGGLRTEPVAVAGRTAMTAALFTRGHAGADGDAIAREIDGLAATLEGFAGRSSLGMHGECLARHLPTVLEHLVECVLTPTFPEAEIDEERRVALEELAAEADDLGQVAIRAMREALFGEHPYGRALRGTRAGLRALDTAALRAGMAGYPVGRGILAFAGDIDLDAVLAVLEGRLAGVGKVGKGGGKGGKARWPGGAPVWPTRARRRVLHREREQAHVAIGYPGLTITDPRVAALEVLVTVLGGQSGRLFHALREAEGLVYQVDASSAEGIDGGNLTLYASTSQDKLERALAAIDGHVERLRREPVGAEELARAQAWLIGQHRIGQQRRARLASQIATAVAFGLPPDHYRRYDGRVAAVTAAEVRALAVELFEPSRRVLGLVRERG